MPLDLHAEDLTAVFNLAKRDLASARYDYLLNLLRLKQAAGTLSEKDPAQISAWLP
jgi:outer membrane protein